MGNARDILVRFLGDSKDIEAKSKQAAKATDAVGESAEKAGGKLPGLKGKVGELVDNIASRVPGASHVMDLLGKSGDDVAEKVGKAGVSAGALATAGGAAIAAFAGSSIAKFEEVAAQVRHFQDVSGVAAEDASRWVEVAGDYGINADEAAGAVGRFAKVVGGSPEVLAKYGVEVARNKDGTVDLNATLQNAATQFSLTDDAARRAELGAALFGKQWTGLVPLLEQGAAGLKESFAGVGNNKILSQEDLDRAREFALQLDGLKDAGEGLMIQFGRALVPAVQQLAETVERATSLLDKGLKPAGTGVGQVLEDMFTSLSRTGASTAGMIETVGNRMVGAAEAAKHSLDRYKDLSDAAQSSLAGNAVKAEEAAAAQQLLNEAIDDGSVALTTEQQSLAAAAVAQEKLADEQAASTREAERQTDNVKLLEKAHKDLTDRIHEAAQAAEDSVSETLDYRDAHRRTESAIRDAIKANDDAKKNRKDPQAIADAEAAQDQIAKSILKEADAWVTVRGKNKETKDGAQDYINKLSDLRNEVAEKFPEVAALLDTQISKWRTLAGQIDAANASASGYDQTFVSRGANGEVVRRAAVGGVFRSQPGGHLVNLAEAGQDEAVIPLAGGAVPVTFNGPGLSAPATGGPPLVVNVTVQGSVWHVSELADVLQNELIRRWRITNGQVFSTS